MVLIEERILLGVKATSFDQVVRMLAQTAFDTGVICNVDEFIASVYTREAQAGTNCGQGIGTPHGKSATVISPFMAFAQLATPIVGWAGTEEPVDLVFMIGVPEANENNIHLKIISSLFRRLMNEELLESLKAPHITAVRVLELLSLSIT